MPESGSTPPQQRRPAGHLALGSEGETRAAAHLRSRGYRIVERNVRAGGVELDLVAERGSTLVFIEVKTRRSRRHGGGEDAVGWSKRRRIVAGARAWLFEHRRRTKRIRFDVMVWDVAESTSEAEGRWSLTHYEAAFDAAD